MHARWGRTLSAGQRPAGRLRGVGIGLALVLPLGLVGCADDTPGLAAEQAVALHGRVASVRAAAALENPVAARTAVAQFRADVQRLVEAGSLDPAQAMALLAHADQIDADIVDTVIPPTPKATPSPSTADRTPVNRTRTPERADLNALWAALRERISDRMDEQRREHGRDRGRHQSGRSSDGKGRA